jgi:hypothetical protein
MVINLCLLQLMSDNSLGCSKPWVHSLLLSGDFDWPGFPLTPFIHTLWSRKRRLSSVFNVWTMMMTSGCKSMCSH